MIGTNGKGESGKSVLSERFDDDDDDDDYVIVSVSYVNNLLKIYLTLP